MLHYFEDLFHNSKENAIIIMDKDGIIQRVNEAFTNAYGYTNDDLKSKSYRVLYTKKDQALLRPEIELNLALREGSSSDENYLVHKDGSAIWVTGESVLVKNEAEIQFVKIIHNIHAQKQLERYLLASNEVLEDLFHSVRSGLLLLDGRLRIVKSNAAFNKMFACEAPNEGSKVRDIAHSFWQQEEVRSDIRSVVTTGTRLKKEYIIGDDKTNFRKIQITSKLMSEEEDAERRLLLVVKEM